MRQPDRVTTIKTINKQVQLVRDYIHSMHMIRFYDRLDCDRKEKWGYRYGTGFIYINSRSIMVSHSNAHMSRAVHNLMKIPATHNSNVTARWGYV